MIQIFEQEYNDLLKCKEENKKLKEKLQQLDEDFSNGLLISHINGFNSAKKVMPTGEWLEYPKNKPEEGKEYLIENIDGKKFIREYNTKYEGFNIPEGINRELVESIISSWDRVKRFAEIKNENKYRR